MQFAISVGRASRRGPDESESATLASFHSPVERSLEPLDRALHSHSMPIAARVPIALEARVPSRRLEERRWVLRGLALAVFGSEESADGLKHYIGD